MLLTNIDILLNKTKHAATILLVLLITLILPVKDIRLSSDTFGDSFIQNVLQIRNPPMFCSGGKGDSITVEGIGGETITSTGSEKLLGLHINSSFKWDTHIEKLVLELKKRLNLLEWLFYMKGLDLSLTAPKIRKV